MGDIAEQVEVQVRVERKVGVGRWLVVGIGNTVVLGDEEAEELVVGVGVDKTVVDVGVAASRIDYHHNHSSRIRQTARREDAVAGLAEEDSIVSYKFRN